MPSLETNHYFFEFVLCGQWPVCSAHRCVKVRIVRLEKIENCNMQNHQNKYQNHVLQSYTYNREEVAFLARMLFQAGWHQKTSLPRVTCCLYWIISVYKSVRTYFTTKYHPQSEEHSGGKVHFLFFSFFFHFLSRTESSQNCLSACLYNTHYVCLSFYANHMFVSNTRSNLIIMLLYRSSLQLL